MFYDAVELLGLQDSAVSFVNILTKFLESYRNYSEINLPSNDRQSELILEIWSNRSMNSNTFPFFQFLGDEHPE